MDRERLAFILAGVIAMVWVFTAVVATLTKDYSGLSIVTGIMVLAAGWAFGLGSSRRNGQ